MRDPQALLDGILALRAQMRDEIVAATERRSAESMAAVDRDGAGDTIYAIDTVGEAAVERFAEALARDRTFVMVAEGLPDGRRVYPEGAAEASADCWIVVDPIDGTRGLMYQKRSAWILTAAARNQGGGAARDSAREAPPLGPALGPARRRRARTPIQPADRHAHAAAAAAVVRHEHRPWLRDDRTLFPRRARRAGGDRRRH